MEFKSNPRPGLCHVRYCRRTHYKRSRLCPKHQKRKWRAEHPVHNAYRNIKDRARRKKVPFTLTITQFIEFIEDQNADYMQNKGRRRLCLHLDRKIPHLGYVAGNIQILTCTQNTVKGNKERKPECPF